MINESLNKKYLDFSAMEVLTYHPEVFSRVFLSMLKRSGFLIDSQIAYTIRDRIIDDHDGTNKFLYNAAKFSIPISRLKKEVEFNLRCTGTNFKFYMRGFFSKNWEFNIAKWTLGDLISKMEEKLEIFNKLDKVDDYRAMRDELENYNYEDMEKSQYIKYDDLNKYISSMMDKLEGYEITYSSRKINKNKDSYISFTIVYNYLNDMFNNSSEAYKIASIIEISFKEMKCDFHKKDLEKITKYLMNFCKRKYDFEFYKFDLNGSLDRFEFHGDTRMRVREDNTDLEKELSKIEDKDISSLEEYKQYILTKAFNPSE